MRARPSDEWDDGSEHFEQPPGPPPSPSRGGGGGRGGGGRGGFPRLPALSPRIYFIAAGGLGVVVVLALVAALLGGGGESAERRAPEASMGEPAESGLSPASYSSSPSTGAYAAIERRAQDPAPLTVEEAFPAAARSLEVPDAGMELSLKDKRLDGDCAAAVWGSGVGKELRRGGCTQAVRGVYADTGKGYALTVAVFNLAAREDADRLVGALGGGGGFVRPLQAAAPLDRFGQGFTMARGLAMGHFAAVSWAQRLDGKGDAADDTLLSLLIEGGKAPAVLGRAARAPEDPASPAS
ncbi:hypothetical protein [Actinomadura viridis]|uniref:Uncharacterized protein n=1 Tax=Actinomadura viridis TaxID=58110 RepID=A0A931DK29_9ACTN|nr:hypothetical protein [Actinomadura viridis]MBG6088470.1 hypothetical protein [Actinomadura viridis]